MEVISNAYSKLSERASNLSVPRIARIREEVNERTIKGQKILDLSSGDIDPLLMNPGFSEQLQIAAKSSYRYPHSKGLPQLRERIRDYLQREGFQSITIEDICITTGGIQGLFAIAAILPDSPILQATPYWGPIVEQFAFFNKPILFTRLTNNLELDVEDIEQKLSYKPKPAAFSINSPNNPTGAVFSKESLDEIVELTHKHYIPIIFDEAYHKLVYDPELDVSPSDFLNLEESILVRSFSKTHSLTGSRIGYLVTKNKRWMDAIAKLVLYNTSGVSVPIQTALANIDISAGIDNIRDAYKRKRDTLLQIGEVKGFTIPKIPAGAIYLWLKLDIPRDSPINGRTNFGYNLFKSFPIPTFTVPGDCFGPSPFYDEYLRLTFSVPSAEDLQLVVDMSKEKFGVKE